MKKNIFVIVYLIGLGSIAYGLQPAGLYYYVGFVLSQAHFAGFNGPSRS